MPQEKEKVKSRLRSLLPTCQHLLDFERELNYLHRILDSDEVILAHTTAPIKYVAILTCKRILVFGPTLLSVANNIAWPFGIDKHEVHYREILDHKHQDGWHGFGQIYISFTRKPRCLTLAENKMSDGTKVSEVIIDKLRLWDKALNQH